MTGASSGPKFLMKLHVVHRTVYQYAQPVSDSFNEVRLKPLSADGQTCDAFLLKVLPTARLSHFLDFYFNYVQTFEILELHSVLTVESTADVTTSSSRMAEDADSAPLDALAECARQEFCYDFLQSSKFVLVSPEIWRLAVDACQGQSQVWKCAVAICRFVHAEFKYEQFSTDVHTGSSEVLELRRGVCQDFAHVMIGMCRAWKIPARYVSGYLYNGPADHLTGAQASHAWCEVYLPGLGWRALDPTNNQPADERYVRLAVGRDYADVAPIKGYYKGTKDKRMQVEVSVELLQR
jgi:transglutaminase-like putative cysteine protease